MSHLARGPRRGIDSKANCRLLPTRLLVCDLKGSEAAA